MLTAQRSDKTTDRVQEVTVETTDPTNAICAVYIPRPAPCRIGLLWPRLPPTCALLSAAALRALASRCQEQMLRLGNRCHLDDNHHDAAMDTISKVEVRSKKLRIGTAVCWGYCVKYQDKKERSVGHAPQHSWGMTFGFRKRITGRCYPRGVVQRAPIQLFKYQYGAE